MFNKICPNCENECREVDARCKECGYQFMMLCEGCGRDVKGFSLCKECRQQGYKRAPFDKNAENLDDFGLLADWEDLMGEYD